jgi:hypothetical protein
VSVSLLTTGGISITFNLLTMPFLAGIPKRAQYPRAQDRANCSDGYQEAFDRYSRKHRDWYGSILVRWEAWMLGQKQTRAQEHDLKVAILEFNQWTYLFRAVLPPAIRDLVLRQRRLNWERLCLKEKYDLEANNDVGWRPTDTDVARLNAPHTLVDQRYILPGDDGGNYTYPLEHALDDYADTGMSTLLFMPLSLRGRSDI